MIHHFYLRRQARFTISLLFIVIVDQLTKFLFFDPDVDLLNTGISFSFFSESTGWQQVVMIAFTLVVMGIILRQFGRKFPMFVGLIIGGAVSNVLDRLFFGGVRDFLPVPFLAVHNNLADWGIFLGLLGILFFLILLPFFRGEDLERSLRSPRDRERGEG